MTVRAGQPVKLELPYSGYPAPTFTWTKNGEPLQVSDHVVIKDENNVLQLEISKTNRDDTGDYKLVMSNEIGEAESAMELIVQDRPDPPGDLQIEDINDSGCTIKWEAPKYVGGSNLMNYIVEKMDLRTNTWSKVSWQWFVIDFFLNL